MPNTPFFRRPMFGPGSVDPGPRPPGLLWAHEPNRLGQYGATVHQDGHSGHWYDPSRPGMTEQQVRSANAQLRAGTSSGGAVGEFFGGMDIGQHLYDQFTNIMSEISAEAINQPIMDFHNQFSQQLARSAQLQMEARTRDIEAAQAGMRESRPGVVQSAIRELQQDTQQQFQEILFASTGQVAGMLQQGILKARELTGQAYTAYVSAITSAYQAIMSYQAAQLAASSQRYAANASAHAAMHNAALKADIARDQFALELDKFEAAEQLDKAGLAMAAKEAGWTANKARNLGLIP